MHIQVKHINDTVLHYLNKGVVVLDTETTGFSRHNDRIIEFAGVKYKDGKLVDTLSIMINPCKYIHPNATKVHGITNEMVRDLPTEKDYISTISEFLLGQHYIVGHNVSFDLGFLDAMLGRYGKSFQCTYIDTLQLSREMYPGMGHKLSDMAEFFNIESKGYHRALNDVEVTLQLLLNLVKKR